MHSKFFIGEVYVIGNHNIRSQIFLPTDFMHGMHPYPFFFSLHFSTAPAYMDFMLSIFGRSHAAQNIVCLVESINVIQMFRLKLLQVGTKYGQENEMYNGRKVE